MIKAVPAVVGVVAIVGLFSACGSSPTAPVSLANSPIAASTPPVGSLQLDVSLIDVGEDALGHWQYKTVVSSSEIGGVDLTIEKIDVQLLNGSGDILATASFTPTAPLLRAYSSAHEAVTLTADVHVKTVDATVNVSGQFRDAGGHTGTVSAVYSCFGCWDY